MSKGITGVCKTDIFFAASKKVHDSLRCIRIGVFFLLSSTGWSIYRYIFYKSIARIFRMEISSRVYRSNDYFDIFNGTLSSFLSSLIIRIWLLHCEIRVQKERTNNSRYCK